MKKTEKEITENLKKIRKTVLIITLTPNRLYTVP
jgi:hypothetical protein